MTKTVDGRFVEKRVAINSKILKQIVIQAKKNKKLTWRELGLKLGVCEQTVRHDWINKGNTIPYSIFEKLIKMSNNNLEELKNKIQVKEAFWGQRIKDGVIKTKKISLPDVESEKFAEFYGIMLGDGCVFSNLSGFAVSADKVLEYVYFNKYLKDLIYSLFRVYPSFYYSKKVRSVNCFLYSKLAASFMIKSGFPIGIKSTDKLVIPTYIKSNDKRLARCIRGVMDTDGSLSAHPSSKIMIHLSVPHKPLRESIRDGLIQLDIHYSIFDKGIMIYGKKNVGDFQRKVGFSNFKNIIKYDYFIKNKRVPSSKEVEMFLREKNRALMLDLHFSG